MAYRWCRRRTIPTRRRVAISSSSRRLTSATSGGASQYPWGKDSYQETIEHRTFDEHPENTAMIGTHVITIEVDDRTLLFEGGLDFRSDRENFYYEYFRRLSENGEVVREKKWTETIPRDFQ